MAVDWSDLLPEIVTTIAKECKIYEDFINFMDVCRSWRCAIAEDESFNGPSPLASRFPCLMLAESSSSEEEKEDGYRKFFLLSNTTTTTRVKFPESRNQRCVSSRGWMLFVGEDEFSTKLVHPHSRIQIDLPSLLTFPEYENENEDCVNRHCMRKVVLTSSDPVSDSLFCVFVIWGSTGNLGFCKPGDTRWTNVADGWAGQVYDITYHHGRRQLYALSGWGKIQACDFHTWTQPATATATASLRQITVLPKEFRNIWFHIVYLLVWDDDKLLAVTRQVVNIVKGEVYKTKVFYVFMVDLRDGQWSKLESLGNRAIFVGFNSSFFMEASEDDGCTVKANCIYFTDDCYEFYMNTSKGAGGQDMGVYHMSDGTIEPHLQQESFCQISPPLWLEPTTM